MDVPDALQALGKAFLAALVDRLGRDGAAAVLTLLAHEMTKAEGACQLNRT
jgi:hypothetical protein